MQFEVTAAELNNAASNCLNANETIQGEITAMRNYVAGLMGAYQGPAAMALQNLSDQWGSDALALSNVLTTIANNLTSNANNYVANEDTNTKNYANLTNNLPPARF
ncbi:hypothetical protein GCM10023322_76160 [Rugosimonospora acidiphila]|uniref:ESAT-6-like protein n=1 Tax=Rugosimonospora acidiphila TaxID=556531 RepID=A0ABP9SRG4_9ACTN